MANILVADDDADVLELVHFILEREGHTVYAAGDGQAAIDVAEKEKLDLILLDVMMPKMDGYSLAIYFKENSATTNVPIMIMTAKKQVDDLFQSLSNVVKCIEKPFEPSKLRVAIRKILESKV